MNPCNLCNVSCSMNSCLFLLSGLVWSLRPSDIELEILSVSRKLMSEELEKETGINTGWINNGGLFISSSKERLDEYKRLYSVRKLCRYVLSCCVCKSWLEIIVSFHVCRWVRHMALIHMSWDPKKQRNSTL